MMVVLYNNIVLTSPELSLLEYALSSSLNSLSPEEKSDELFITSSAFIVLSKLTSITIIHDTFTAGL